MCLLLAYSLLVQQEFCNKNRFDVLAIRLKLMDKEELDLDKTVIDLTMDNKLVAKFIDLSKDPEVFALCSSSSFAGSSAGSLTSSLPSSGIMPWRLLFYMVSMLPQTVTFLPPVHRWTSRTSTSQIDGDLNQIQEVKTS